MGIGAFERRDHDLNESFKIIEKASITFENDIIKDDNKNHERGSDPWFCYDIRKKSLYIYLFVHFQTFEEIIST